MPRTPRRPLRFLAVALAAAAACNRGPASAPPSGMPPAPAATERAPAAAPPATTGAAAVHAPTTQPEVSVTSGKLLEKIATPDYTYLRIGSGAGEVWAAVPAATVTVGAEVTVLGQMVVSDFESKALGRRFDRVIFGTLGGEQAGAAATGHGAAAGAAAGAAPAPTVPAGSPHATVPAGIGDLKVPRAEGPEGRTIVEVYAQRAALRDRPIAVRGKVVKYTPDVMGKNWLHLRDATGSDGAGDNDLSATTTGETKVGDVVLLKGTLRLDRDFGSGYHYPLLIEDAALGR